MKGEGICETKIGRKGDNQGINSLAFSGRCGNPSWKLKINIIKETAEIAGLKLSFEKTEYMTAMK